MSKTKSKDMILLKRNFGEFGDDILKVFKAHWKENGMSFRDLALVDTCSILVDQVTDLSTAVMKDKDREEVLKRLVDATNTMYMMYINIKEK